MPFIIDEQKMVNDNTFEYETRIQSPTARLLETTQTYVTYYHIDVDESTTDTGFKDVASIIGWRSPIKFNKIENFPLYGLEQIALQLQDEEQGLDTSYEGEAVILPNTIKPVQNDFFIIPILKDSYVFRVTDIQYDNVMQDNYYKINFQLEYLDDEMLKELDKQKNEEYTCVLENIGTEDRCIIEKSLYHDIKDIEKMYDEIVDFFKVMFYNEKHNVFLAPIEMNHFLYDPQQSEFINKHQLINKRNDLVTIMLTDQISDPQMKLKYAKSMYRFIELRDLKLLTNFPYRKRPGVTIHESSFYRWTDRTVDVVDIPLYPPTDPDEYLSNEFVNTIKMNGECDSEFADIIKRYVRGEEIGIHDISLKLGDELLYFNNSLEVYVFTPIILYIIKDIIHNTLSKEK